MPVLIEQLIPWTRQPPPGVGFGIDWSNPLTKGLEFVHNTALKGYEAKSGKLSSYAGGITWTPEGFSSAGTTAGTYIQSKNAARLGGLSNSTVFALSRTSAAVDSGSPGISGNISGGGNVIYCERGSSGNDIYKLDWAYPAAGELPNTLTAEFAYRNDAGTLLQKRISATGLNDGRLVASAIVKNGTEHSVYVDGRLNSGAFGSASTAFTDASVESWIGDDKADTASQWNGAIPLVLGWSRSLSKDELDSLRRNPWQLFAPQVELIPAPVAAPSSPQFDAASNSGYQTAQTTYSWSHTCSGADRLLIVSIAISGTYTSISVTYGGVALTWRRDEVISGLSTEIWTLVAPAVGAGTIVVTLNGSVNSAAIAVSYTGVDQAAPTYGIASASSANAGGTDAAITVNTTFYNSVVIDAAVSVDTAITAGAGQTVAGQITGAAFSFGVSSEGLIAPGSVAMSWTDIGAGSKWATAVIALRPVSAISTLFADSDLRYSILAALQADSDQRWSVLNSANADSTTQWSLLNAALADSDQRWSTLNAAQGDSSQQWSVLNAALADADVRWSLLQALQSDSTLQWSVLNAILADTDQRWSVLAGVFTDSDLRWDLQSALSAVFADSDLRWDLQSALTAVFQDADLRHSILNAVLNDADLRHSILNAVNADSDQRWSIVNAAQADGTYQWSLVAAIQNDSSLQWDLQSALAAVFQDSTLQWSLVAAVQQQLDAQWSLLNAVQIDADARWSIANAVAQDLTAQWSALGAAYKDATIQWDSLAISETTATLSWSIQSEAVPPKIISIVFSTKTRSIVFSAKPN